MRLRVLPHNRSLSSSSTVSSDLHAFNSSSSLGLGTAHADLPHFTAYSSSASHCSAHSPAPRGSYVGSTPGIPASAVPYPSVHLAHDTAQGTAGAGRSRQRPHSRSGSSGGTSDSWKLSTVNPLFAAGPLARSSLPEAAAFERMGGDVAAHRPADALWAGCSPYVRTAVFSSGCDQDARAPVGSVKGDGLAINFSKLAAQVAAPSATLAAEALAAGAGRSQVIQVYYTGAVDAVPVPAYPSPSPSPHQVRELAQLLPPAAGGGEDEAAEAALAAADAAEAGRAGQQGVDGVAAADKDVSRRGGRGHRLKQWRAALSGRMKGLRGGSKGKGAAAGGAGSGAPAFSLRSNSSVNDHMLGFAGGSQAAMQCLTHESWLALAGTGCQDQDESMTAHVVLGVLSGPHSTRCSVLFAIAAGELLGHVSVAAVFNFSQGQGHASPPMSSHALIPKRSLPTSALSCSGCRSVSGAHAACSAQIVARTATSRASSPGAYRVSKLSVRVGGKAKLLGHELASCQHNVAG